MEKDTVMKKRHVPQHRDIYDQGNNFSSDVFGFMNIYREIILIGVV